MSPKIVDGSFAALFDNNEVHFKSSLVFGKDVFYQKENGSLAKGRIAYPSGYSDYYVFKKTKRVYMKLKTNLSYFYQIHFSKVAGVSYEY